MAVQTHGKETQSAPKGYYRPTHRLLITLGLSLLMVVGGLGLGPGLTTEIVTTAAPASRPWAAPGDCQVTSLADSGAGSLRQCVLGLQPGAVITFNASIFPVGNPATINLAGALPAIVTDDVTLDAGQAGAILNGQGLGLVDGLVIDGASGVIIKGFQIRGFAGANLTAVATDLEGSSSEFSNNGGGVFERSGQALGSSGRPSQGQGQTQASNDGQALALALGDLNLDGQIDAFVVNDTELQVWLNDGTGAYTPGQSLSTSGGQAVALGDLDQDGDLDAVVGHSSSAQLWLNNGQANFTAGAGLGSGDSQAVAVGDLNGDGAPDVVIGNGGAQDNQLWLNDGSGAFSLGQALGSGDSQAVALGDLNGDGAPDVVIGNGGNQANQLWLNDGSGAFSLGQALGSSDSQAIGLGDLNQDGLPDIVLGNNGPTQIWLNQGNGNFSLGQSLGEASDSQAVGLGDLNSDGYPDLLIGNGGNQSDQIWLNGGSGAFNPGQALDGSDSQAVGLGDLDHDNDLDALIVTGSGQFDQVWLNQNKVVLRTGPAGGLLTALTVQGLTTTLEIPAGVLAQNTTLSYIPLAGVSHPLPPDLRFANRAFNLAAEQAGGPVSNPFVGPVTLRVDYHPLEPAPDALELDYWDESLLQWLDAATRAVQC